MSSNLYESIRKYWYPIVTKVFKDHDVVFLNYGYLDEKLNGDTLPLEAEDENNRYCIQLYHQVASHVDLKGKDVLEVSSGHGGGASFISRYHKPRSYTGLERNPKAVEFCKKRHQIKGLSFIEGDATKIHLEDESMDAVVNVEASHIYSDSQKFFDGVARVLRPGGHFLTTDYRPKDNVAQWKDDLAAAGMKAIREVDITQNVVKAMSEMHEWRLEMINTYAPKSLKLWLRQFAGTRESTIYKKFHSGTHIYMSFALQKVRA